jgi:HTH-type transcriptional regulator, sugar sensing transcriptional regulator
MTPQEALKTIGLTEKETAIYMASLELGQDSVSNISKKAGIKRPTAYLILDSLRERGLINTSTKGAKTIYGAEEPSKLLGLVTEKERALRTVLPYLEAINNRSIVKPRIRYFEGKEGVRRIYEEFSKAPEMRFWGSMEYITKDFHDVIEMYVEIFNKSKTKVYDLLTDTPNDHWYARQVIRPGYEIKLFPKNAKIFTDSMILDTKISLIAYDPEPHGLIIESEKIAISMRTLWEMAWKSARPYKKK